MRTGPGRQARARRRRAAAAARHRARRSTRRWCRGWWIGLALLHTLFTHEHNAICDRLAEADTRLVGRRAVRARPAGQRGAAGQDPHRRVDAGDHRAPDHAWSRMRANWWGVEGERLHERVRPPQPQRGDQRHPRLADRPPRRALLRSPRSSSSVYRMHPLIPDDYSFRSRGRRQHAAETTFPELDRPARARACSSRSPMPDLLYSFGTAHPGAITLHNYPRFLQRVRAARRHAHRPRRRPTSCASASAACRATTSSARLLHLQAGGETFEDLTDNPELGEQIRERLRRRHRARRPDGRPVRRAAAARASASATRRSGSSS